MFLVSDGPRVLEHLKQVFADAGLSHQLDNKLRDIVAGERHTYGEVDLRLRLFRVALDTSSDYNLEVRTAKPRGHLTDPNKVYQIVMSRNDAGLVLGFRQ